ncbi:MAG: alpha/beta hydrolase-fold protein [Roseivirga sp.]
MKKIKALLLLTLLLSLDTLTAQESTPFTLNQVQVVPIKDTQNDRAYELYIELPEGYAENPDKHYPVLYYTDALWHLETLAAGQEYIYNDLILVGISWQKDINEALIEEHGAHVSRFRDYSVIPSDKPEIQDKYQLGQAANHLAFIRNDVFKYVEGNYRTDPSSRSYFGYSAGGVFGCYALLSQPDTFKNYILGSPALNGDIPYFTELAAASKQHLNANVFISYGTEEAEQLTSYGEPFIALLKARNDQSLSITHPVIEGSHQTAFPLTGIKSVTWLSGLIKE